MAGNIFGEVHAPTDFETGKDGGAAALAEMAGFKNCIVAEYVWVDSKGQTRSKCKTVTAKPDAADDCAIWSYNGAQCGQAEAGSSDVYLVPRKVFDDPVRGAPHVLVVCESITASMEAAPGNYRAECSETMEKHAGADPWFACEQEYVCCNDQGSPLSVAGSPSDFYCGRGALNLANGMRELMGDHYAMCMRAGIKISGMNCEAGAAQGEFQIGPCKGINIGDHMIAARHTLHKAANKYRVAITFAPIVDGVDFGNGCHMNFSTRQTRGDGGLTVIEKIGRALGRRAKEALALYGEGNDKRLSGTNLAPDAANFRFGVADRTAAVRIPRACGIVGKGWLEDRRPGGNCDPYRVATHVMRTAGDVLANMK